MKILHLPMTLILAAFSAVLWAQDTTRSDQPAQPAAGTVEAVETADTDRDVLEDTADAAMESPDSEAKPGGSQAAVVTVVEEEVPDTVFRGERVVISNNNSLERNERSDDMVTIMGNSQSFGYVDGDMVTVLGNAELDGTVDGDFVVVMGSAELGPNAKIDGNAVVIGGKITKHPQSRIDGETVNIPFFSAAIVEHFQELPLFVRECVFLARPIAPNVRITLYIAGVFLLFYLLLAALFPKPLKNGRKAIENKPLQSFFAGVLVLALHIPFIILLLITVVGIFLVPLVDFALVAMAVFGKAVTFHFIGTQIGKALRITALENPILSIFLGGLVGYALYMIPFFGLFLWVLLSILGLGAVCVAVGESISTRKTSQSPSEPPTLRRTFGANPTGESIEDTTAFPQPSVPLGTALSQIDNATAALFPRVGFWWRALATVIDFILVALVSSVLNVEGPLVPLFIYFIVFWGWKGSSLGGMALGLRVQKISGEPPDWPTSLIRSFSSIISFLPFCLGFFWAGWDSENQSWHDKIAGTTVVRIPKGYTWN